MKVSTIRNGLLKSPRYSIFMAHMLEVTTMTEAQIETLIQEHLPWLLDPNYMGHDENGMPCKSVRQES